jgi:hypothetical protein
MTEAQIVDRPETNLGWRTFTPGPHDPRGLGQGLGAGRPFVRRPFLSGLRHRGDFVSVDSGRQWGRWVYPGPLRGRLVFCCWLWPSPIIKPFTLIPLAAGLTESQKKTWARSVGYYTSDPTIGNGISAHSPSLSRGWSTTVPV